MTTSIKLAQVLAGGSAGGAENYFTRMACALQEYPNLQQRAFTRPNVLREERLQKAGVDYNTFRFGGKLSLLDHWQYRKALRDFSPDIVLSYMNRATSLTPASTHYQLVGRLGHYYDLKYYRHCDHWIGITKGICDHLIQGGMPPSRVTKIGNFVDETSADPLPRSSFNTNGQEPILLATGRLHENKAFDTLLKAFKKVPQGTLWLAGSGPEEKALKSLCSALELNERVRFLGWRNDINALLRTADVYICSSRHEGLGSIVPEAWFNQCPIVATRSQGPGELIEHETTGLLCEIDDDGALASHINVILDSPTLGKKLAVNAKCHYETHYSQKVITGAYLQFFEHLTR
ncbi:glycosyltransferase [Marinibactrum halimedae]|uniref:Glycosyl transferase n=1 Tax=Marinibactrum halimedae TaxID=1444977 RepID=A0AA37T5U2_9GAMM|nr:glycosyltransferase [Marinibactrum halimedae]MCD9460467.1 glycosyltransferase [Marinibactrum halimedae]GLS25873.1 glycosyl transferase [Marinibactrum halimedae]